MRQPAVQIQPVPPQELLRCDVQEELLAIVNISPLLEISTVTNLLCPATVNSTHSSTVRTLIHLNPIFDLTVL